MPYEAFLKKEIFGPCRMIDTTFEPTPSQWPRLIAMHDKKDGESILGETFEGCVFEFVPPSNPLGGAGLISSASDYLNFAHMLMNDGDFEGRRILSKNAVEEISTPHVPEGIQSGVQRWGLGVRVITSENYGRLPVGTYGWSGAYGTHFWIDKENQTVGIYMKNSRYDGGSGARTSASFEKDVITALG
jgi:CubicO group peptidase (beta-lactamase class C family)